MKRIIAGIEYDTDLSEFISKRTDGSIGDESGFEECLFRTAEGKYFLYANGGKKSKYPKESIRRISSKAAEQWLKENGK